MPTLPGGQQIQTAFSPGQSFSDYSTGGGASGGLGAGYSQFPSLGGGDMNQAGANSDPFGYTNGSLLTPWTQQFHYTPTTQPSSGGAGGGPAPAAAPGFNFGFEGYNPQGVGSFNLGDAFKAPDAFSGGRLDAPQNFSGNRQDAGPGFNAPVGAYNPAQFQGAGNFAAGPQFQQDRVGAFDAFKAPDVTQDPGYQFRLKQGQDALMNSAAAKGLLRNGGTAMSLMDYNQGAASQEYGAAYGRAKGEYDTAQNLKLAAYDRNSAANRDENTINFDQRLSGYNANAQNARDVYDRNYQAGLTANEQTYNRGASEYDRNQQNRFQANESNYARDFGENQANYQRNFDVNQANYGRAQGEYQQNFGNQRDVYQMNTGNQLAAYQANAQNAQAMGQLGMESAFGTYDRQFQNYSTGFQIDEQRRQQAAAMAAAGAGAGRAQEQQDYNRQLAEYQMGYGQFQDNQNTQFQRLYSLAALGQGAAGQVGNFGGQYANAAGGYMTGAGNAMAAGQVGAANAWQQGYQGAGSAGMQAAGMYLGSQQPTYQRNAPLYA